MVGAILFGFALLAGSFTPAAAEEAPASVRILAYNVFFDDRSGRDRYPKIRRFLKESDADIICLQEVTKLFIEQLRADPALKEYDIAIAEKPGWYEAALLSRLPISKRWITPFDETAMGRRAISGMIEAHGRSFVVAGVHLESGLKDGDIRKIQLANVANDQRAHPMAVICGDFNFGDRENDDEDLPASYRDLSDGSKKPTFDVSANRLTHKTRRPGERSRRLDRIYAKGFQEWEDYQVHPVPYSDHFPVSVVLRLPSTTDRAR